jgi:hypothetical protein
MTGEKQARLLGLFFWLFTAFNLVLVVAVAVIYLAIFGFVFSQQPQRPGEPDAALIMTVLIAVFVFAFVFAVLFSIPKVVAGYGLRRGAPWARVWTIVASAMSLLSFPFGTAIGVFGLVFLFGDEGKKYFAELETGGMNRFANLNAATAEPIAHERSAQPEAGSWR